MIKIDKDLTDIPESLIPAFPELFQHLPYIPVITRHTHAKRMEIINAGNYLDIDRYNSQYKRDDIKTALLLIYHDKCAFCEMQIEQLHVEHYRPKSVYYWLAFSWDNLLLACSTCNINKGVKFALDGLQATFDPTDENIRNINTSSAAYDATELPHLVNPEVTDPEGQIVFHRNGLITSANARFAYTIEACELDRTSLNDIRKHLLDVYERDVRSALVDHAEPKDQQREIESIVRKFIRDAMDPKQPFLAFRKFALTANWLSDIVTEIN